MSEDYLWDRSGPPDAAIERIERALAPLRLAAPGLGPARRPTVRVHRLAAAAVVVLAAGALLQPALRRTEATAWQVESLHGSARLGPRGAGVSMRISAGQTLRTGSASELSLLASEVGRVDLGPNSELRAAASRLQLNRGTLHAFIWAPPGRFVVDTPSARATDLGCEYTLTVKPSGNGLLSVVFGWVAFQFEGKEALIPAGAECATRHRQGPGIPYYADAPQPLKDALAAFEGGDPYALPRTLELARPRDALSLWHLLVRVPPAQRGAVFDRFAQFVELPPAVTREGALSGDAKTIDLCWNALGLEHIDWWRDWERKWSE